MDYHRVTPRARSGTSGVSTEDDITAEEGNNYVWISVPERIAAITTAVHMPENVSAEFAIEATCNRAETVGPYGEGGYWDAVEEENPTYTENKVLMLANAVTGIRVRCIRAEWNDGEAHENPASINVCFCG